MNGMNAQTGKHLSGVEHLNQSIADILTTPLGSRVMRRDYGSIIPRLVDAPVNTATQLRLYAASAHAIAKWEPKVTLKRVVLAQGETGAFELTIYGEDGDGQPVALGVPL